MSESDDATKPTAEAVERADAALDIATRQPVVRPIPRWVIVAGVPVMVSVAVAAAWFLLGTGATTVELDAIRTAGTLGVGFGGVVALWLAVRRQRSTELDLLQKYEAHRLAELVAAHNQEIADRAAVHAEHDSRERRLTDLYLKAVEQLGSEKAAVRHGGLYALERVAQDNPEQRQTVVSVLCAYLRAPVELPDDYRLPDAARSRRGYGIHRPLAQANRVRSSPRAWSNQAVLPSRVELDNGTRQELEVRLTAQQILHKHLKVGEDLEHPSDEFWADMDLDLRSATLVNFDLRHRTRLQGADFVGATFVGNALFEGTTFTGPAWFDGATFTGVASFDSARFGREISFGNAHFDDLAWFNGTHFDGVARFVSATFRGDAKFVNTTFAEYAGFERTIIGREAGFSEARFGGEAKFAAASFGSDAGFGRAVFRREANFEGATFSGDAMFADATFAEYAGFEQATFVGAAGFERTNFGGDTWFAAANFGSNSRFAGATFAGEARFGDATFSDDVRFAEATFMNEARFEEASFSSRAGFERARFGGDAMFRGTRFGGDVSFTGANFTAVASFGWASFGRDVGFDRASFDGLVAFDEVTFEGVVGFTGAKFADEVPVQLQAARRIGRS